MHHSEFHVWWHNNKWNIPSSKPKANSNNQAGCPTQNTCDHSAALLMPLSILMGKLELESCITLYPEHMQQDPDDCQDWENAKVNVCENIWVLCSLSRVTQNVMVP
jgi:hypothetical protein